MTMRALAFALLCLVTATVSAEIYKWVDPDGSVVYSDTPRKNAEKVELPPPSTYSPPPLPSMQTTARPSPTQQDAYQSFAIVQPQPEQTFWNQPNVDVVVALQPALQTGKGHRIEITLDGKPLPATTGLQVSLGNLDRGTHTVSAAVDDAGGTPLLSAGPVTFYVKQHSIQFPNASKPAPKKPVP